MSAGVGKSYRMLQEARALLKNGIDPSRITYKGYAMMRPLVTPEVTIGDQIKNRRVEVMVTGK